MFKIVAITNRQLCRGNFLEQIEKIASAGVSDIILREKDLSAAEYEIFAKSAMAVCKRYGTKCIAHQFIDAAKRIGFDEIHLPLSVLEENPNAAKSFSRLGVSVHSPEQARQAVLLGADYLMVGHIFQTNSKKGLMPKGLPFLKALCEQIPVPIYAIGGISEHNIFAVRDIGAAGACLMSSFMQNDDVSSFVASLKKALIPACNPLNSSQSTAALHFRRACSADTPALETLLNAFYIGNLSADEARAHGFLATPFTQAQIAGFSKGLGALVAVEHETVLGFLGLMESDAPFAPPVVQAMVAAMRHATFEGQPLAACKPFLFGPIAISRQAQGRGIFRGLYRAMWDFLDPSRYELGLAFINQDNHHSLTVHQQALGVTVLTPFTCGDDAYWLVAYRRPIR